MKHVGVAAIAIVMLVLTPWSARAQDANTSAKHELGLRLARLLTQQNLGPKMIEQVVEVYRAQWPMLLRALADAETDLSSEERQRIVSEADESFTRFSKAYVDKLEKEVDVSAALERMSAEIYEAHFTEQELQDLVTFYDSPTGRKTLTLMPTLFAEGAAKGQELLQSSAQRVAEAEILNEFELLKRKHARKRKSA
jgi:hypothetical protein